jgi:hypothetical protein
MKALYGLFWLLFYIGAYYSEKYLGFVSWVGMTFVQPFLPADSKVNGAQLLICFLILIFFGGGATVLKKD